MSSGSRPNAAQDSLDAFVSCLALMVALWCSGPIWNFTSDTVYAALSKSYGPEMAQLGTFVWGAISTATVFFLCKATLLLLVSIIVARGAMALI